MNRLKLLLLLLVFPMSMVAEDDSYMALIITMKDMQTHTFALPDRPQVRFAEGELRVHSDVTDAAFPLAEVLRFNYEKVSQMGIYEPSDKATDLSYEGGVLILSNIKAGEQACIYGTDGRLVRQLTAKRTGTYRLNLSSLATGVYVVRTGKTSYKITKR